MTAPQGNAGHLGRRVQRRLSAFADAHPYLSVGAVALAARLAFAVVSFVVNDGVLIPDEAQYIDLATKVASGGTADEWYPFYGQSLYDSIWIFIAPLRLLFELISASRIVGQLWALTFGVATAVVATRLAREVLDHRLAVAAGLVVAVLPSQVLWSSVVLRESLVWVGLAVAGLGATMAVRSDRIRPAVGWFAVCIAGLLVVGNLRDQTMLAATWMLPIGVVLAAPRRFLRSVGPALAVVLLVPAASGTGVAGWDLVKRTVPGLAESRAWLAAGADSAFTGTTLPTATTVTTTTTTATTVTTTPGSPSTTVAPSTPGPGEIALTSPSGEIVVVDEDIIPDGGSAVVSQNGDVYVVDAGELALATPRGDIVVIDEGTIEEGSQPIVSADGKVYVVDAEGGVGGLSTVLTGAVAVLLRPFLSDDTGSIALRIASVENLAWYVLYVLAAVGLVLGWRRLRPLAYPVLVAIAILGVAFLTQANLGTAFRHRGQILWILVVPAFVGLDELRRRRDERRGGRDARGVEVVDDTTTAPAGAVSERAVIGR